MNRGPGVFIKYVANFAGAGVTVSNDALAGDACVDGDASVQMGRGTAGTTFELRLQDLPETLLARIRAATPSHVRIALGYFDADTGPVVDGICEKVEEDVVEGRFVVTVSGREQALYACGVTPYKASPQGKGLAPATVVAGVLDQAQVPADCVDRRPLVTGALAGTLDDPSFQSRTVLGALDEIALAAGAELLIVDRTVILGAPIRDDRAAPASFDPQANLARYRLHRTVVSGADDLNAGVDTGDTVVDGFTFTVLGNPALRPGQRVVPSNTSRINQQAEYRIAEITHDFSTTSGYVCRGTALNPAATSAAARRVAAATEATPAGFARDLRERLRIQLEANPQVELCEVKAAPARCTADLYYGQAAPAGATQPSIRFPVQHDADHVYAARPVASAFAWRKCGLVTPAYPGMRALVAHNRGLAGDAVVAGYVWTQQPDAPPPASQAGDWWLCLPTDFDTTRPPSDSTAAANDLTANDGRRALELKGLKITVGAAGMSKLGERPALGDAEVCTIAHASGAVVTIRNGEIDVDTGSGPKITLGASGITLSDGKLDMRLANGQLAIG